MNYQKIYNELISKRNIYKLQKCGDGSIESHHILPKCCNGDNSSDNIVNLYCREHYVAHLLLAKIYENTEYYYQLLCAIRKIKGKVAQIGLKINNRLYQILKIKQMELRKNRARKYTYDGKTLTVAQWSEITGISHQMINTRLREGWSFERAITTKPQRSKNDKIKIDGKYLSINELSKIYGLPTKIIMYRLKHTKWDIHTILQTPVIHYSNRKQLYKVQKYTSKHSKPVFMYDKNNTFLKEFMSLSDAYKHILKLGLSKNANYWQGSHRISMCASGKQKFAYGYIWKYKNGQL